MIDAGINDAMIIKTQEDFFNKYIYLSFYCKGSKGLFMVCVWEVLETEHKL